MPTRKPSSVPWIGVVVLAVLLCGYVGAYYAMVRPINSKDLLGTEVAYYSSWHPSHRSAYQKATKRLFAPLHWLDCRIRIQVWEDKWEMRNRK